MIRAVLRRILTSLLTLTCSRSPMSREGGTTLTSLTSDSAMARRRFSLLLPCGYACREGQWSYSAQITELFYCTTHYYLT